MKRISLSLAAFFLMLLCSLTLAARAHALGSVPVPENLELVTRRNVPLTGRLTARDAEGGVRAFVLTTRPIRGTLTLAEDGRFVYTPRPDRKGRDYFGFRAADAAGNLSEEGTVLIRIAG